MLCSRKMSLFNLGSPSYTSFQLLEASWWFNHILRPSNESHRCLPGKDPWLNTVRLWCNKLLDAHEWSTVTCDIQIRPQVFLTLPGLKCFTFYFQHTKNKTKATKVSIQWKRSNMGEKRQQPVNSGVLQWHCMHKEKITRQIWGYKWSSCKLCQLLCPHAVSTAELFGWRCLPFSS